MMPSGYRAPGLKFLATKMMSFGYKPPAPRMTPDDRQPSPWAHVLPEASRPPARSSAEEVMRAFTLGTYYNPAKKHYGRDVSVVCDRCSKSDLRVCIGTDTTDICLACAAALDAAEAVRVSCACVGSFAAVTVPLCVGAVCCAGEECASHCSFHRG